MAVSADDKAKAVALKNQGNEAFKKHDWPTAVEFYGKAIELDDTEPTYFANRAQVRHQPDPKPNCFVGRVTDNIPSKHRPISRQKHMAMRSQMRPRQSS